jgi:malto-oligosyltrehalose trehalohydrolase
MKRRHSMPFGATVMQDATRFRLWAPAAQTVEVGVGRDDATAAWQALAREEGGWFDRTLSQIGHGARYRYRLDGRTVVPDPASRYNPGDVHGASEVVDPAAFDWDDDAWRGRPWDEAVIYELHVGAFTEGGQFGDVLTCVDHLVDLGVTAIELMPLADFPGRRDWGYDGVLMFAPDASYGRPEDLKRLIAAAHRRGLMVLLDVVYNHFGPEGNYLHLYAPQFFTDRHPTLWGAGIDFDGPQSRVVRAFFIHNALYWLEEFGLDGLRLDAVDAIADDSTPDFLTELAAAVHAGPARDRTVHLVLENDRNEARRLVRDAQGRPRQYTAQWNDDLHHTLHGILTGERDGYYGDFADAPLARLGRCLTEGFAYQGEPSPFRANAPRGEPSAQLPPAAFVAFLQNHDQVGNRAFGERLHVLCDAAALRAALAIVLLAPSPPLLFMGEEFGAATPFLYFCDVEPALAAEVAHGRRREFSRFARFADPRTAATIPDPTREETFIASKLAWASPTHPVHAAWLAFYRKLLALRVRQIVPLIARLASAGRTWHHDDSGPLVVRWPLADGRVLALYTNLRNEGCRWCEAPQSDAGRIYAQPDDAGRDDGLPPWAVLWRLERTA